MKQIENFIDKWVVVLWHEGLPEFLIFLLSLLFKVLYCYAVDQNLTEIRKGAVDLCYMFANFTYSTLLKEMTGQWSNSGGSI